MYLSQEWGCTFFYTQNRIFGKCGAFSQCVAAEQRNFYGIFTNYKKSGYLQGKVESIILYMFFNKK